IDAPLSIVDKRREKAGEVAEMTVIGDVTGKTCVIVDDICDTAGTLCKAAELLMEKGAARVVAYISHGVLSGPALERIEKSVLDVLVTTDSIEPTPAAAANPKIRRVPLAPLLSQAILSVANDTSVSSLFQHDEVSSLYPELATP
ncbi:MAG: ribose-phosphate diphosphokinase, partial [Pseudomonadota bacterium]